MGLRGVIDRIDFYNNGDDIYVKIIDYKSGSSIVIMTDGLASFPPQEEALGIPVLWIIVDTEIKPPWGNLVTMKSDGFI